MSEDSSQKTEQPTARRLRKAVEEGDVARSVELPAAAVMISAAIVIALMGSWWASRFSQQMQQGFSFDRRTLEMPTVMPSTFFYALAEGLLVVLPLLLVTAVVAIAASGVTGGFHFAAKAFMPRFSKLSPISGLKRMLGLHALVELLKAIAKFSVVSLVLWWLLDRYLVDLIRVANMGLEPAMALTGQMIIQSVLWLTFSLVVIALIDAPYQRWSYIKKLRMTKQEIKDELKDMEGRPEVKQQIRRRQREMANARMISKIKDADVVITNPEHFAVALAYDPSSDGAPVLLAKGADHMAAMIRKEAQQHGVEMFSSPQLARALYFTTEVDQPIPEALYHAVAPVIAYVFSLVQVRPGAEPMAKPRPVVPPSMRFDAHGRLETA